MFTECDPRPEPVDIARASGVIDKTFTRRIRFRISRSTRFPGSFFFFELRCHEKQGNGKE